MSHAYSSPDVSGPEVGTQSSPLTKPPTLHTAQALVSISELSALPGPPAHLKVRLRWSFV